MSWNNQVLWLYFVLVGVGGVTVQAEDKPIHSKECSLLFRIERTSLERDKDPIATKNPVDHVVLGTRSRGTAISNGVLSTFVDEKSSSPAVLVSASGRVVTDTTGINGPARIYGKTVTDFTCRSRVTFTLNEGFAAEPMQLQSKTSLQVNNFTSDKPGLRGRLIRRVAWKRADEAHLQAEAIVARLTEDGIRRDMEHAIKAYLAELNEQAKGIRMLSSLLPGDRELRMNCADRKIVSFYIGEQFPQNLPAANNSASAEIWLRRPRETERSWPRDWSSLSSHIASPNVPLASFLKVPQQLVDSALPVAVHGEWLVVRLGPEEEKTLANQDAPRLDN